MNRFLFTGNSFSAALVADEEFNGCEVVIATYTANSAEEAKEKALNEYEGLNIEELTAYEIK